MEPIPLSMSESQIKNQNIIILTYHDRIPDSQIIQVTILFLEAIKTGCFVRVISQLIRSGNGCLVITYMFMPTKIHQEIPVLSVNVRSQKQWPLSGCYRLRHSVVSGLLSICTINKKYSRWGHWYRQNNRKYLIAKKHKSAINVEKNSFLV